MPLTSLDVEPARPLIAVTVLVLLFSSCLVIQVMTQETFVIQVFLPLTGPNATNCTHWRRAMELAISSSSHAGMYSLSVINTDGNPSHIIQQALIAARTPSVIAFISTGWDPWLLEELEDISQHFSVRPNLHLVLT